MSTALKPNEFQVVVVGFGPSGAVATSLLGDRGIRTLAIDRQRGVYDKPRAIAIDHVRNKSVTLGRVQHRKTL